MNKDNPQNNIDENTVGNTDNSTETPASVKKSGKIFKRTLKIIGWTVGSLIMLVAIVLCLIVWILTPAKLTPIVERIANDYTIDSDIKIERVELTVWKTFPYASLDIRGLDITSNALAKFGDTIPAYADSLLHIGKMRAEINLAKLPLMKIDIKEIILDDPKINVVVLNDSTANYMIYQSTPPDTTESEVSFMPDVVVRKFSITNNRGIRYTDMAQRMSATLNTDSIELRYNDKDHFYTLLFKGRIFADMPDYGIRQTIPFYFNGDINWNTKNPYKCTLREFKAEVARMPVKINADFALGDTVSVNSLNIALSPIKYSDITAQVPTSYLHGLERIKTDFEMSVNAVLNRPFAMVKDEEPSFTADIQIPECYVQPGKYHDYRINKFAAEGKLVYDGKNRHKTRFMLDKLLLDGFGINLSASGNAVDLLNNPDIDGKISGKIDFAKVLKLIPKELPIRLSGLMSLNTTMKFALSDLSMNKFQNMHVNGDMEFKDVRYTVPKDSMLVFLKHAGIKFGTDSKYKTADKVNRKLLMASVSIDSAFAAVPGLFLTVNNASVGAGAAGSTAELMDTSYITPIGARIKIGKLTFINKADSAMFRMRGLESNASLRRFNDGMRMPLMNFDIHTSNMRYRDRTTSFNLRNGEIALSANARPKREQQRIARMKARIDSLCRIYPELSRDSVISMYVAKRKLRNKKSLSEDEYMDLSVDNKLKKILRNWDARGSLRAKRGALFTPYFPLRNRISDLNMSFNLDTFRINSMRYDVGHSDLAMHGSISNIRSTLLGSKRRQLTVRFNVVSDTMDVNQLMKAMYKGTAFASDTVKSSSFNFAATDDNDESTMQTMVDDSSDDTDTTIHHALIIPKNIALQFAIRNRFTRYSDLDLHNLRSDLHINNGVLSLRNLSGKAEGGSLSLDMVYATADKKDIGLGLFMDLKNIQVGRFLELIPDIDTVMPMLKGVDGLINARLGATTKVDSLMNVITPTTNAALKISGTNLILLDSETFRKIAKMLMFKNKDKNLVDSLSVELAAYDSKIDIYPFILNMDRYRLGIMGTNDFDMNYNFHVSILKSPIPFKFGINISGNSDDMKIRVGKAKLKENQVARSTLVTDTTRRNLFRQMNEIFRRGAEAALKGEDLHIYGKNDRLRMDRKRRKDLSGDIDSDTLSRADSLQLIKEGIIERQDSIPVNTETVERQNGRNKSLKSRKNRRNKQKNIPANSNKEAIKPENKD